ncbi:MAG: cytochrome c3 family protein [Vicinamibacteria bacterium]|nr:cytochrome c3 family protein [Vicinamibacteria bacterium]
MKGTWIALATTLVLGGAAALVAPYPALTPGPLGPGHLKLGNDCLSCHVLLSGPSRDKCVSCHPIDGIGLRTSDGQPRRPERPRSNRVHRALAGGQAACDTCHVAHRGAPGGAPDLRFSHAVLPAELRPQCLDCHTEDRPRDGLHANLAANCSNCHGSEAWKPATFEHERYFRFDRHHPSRCTDCHPVASDFKVYTCYGCHEHTPAKMADEHRKVKAQDLGRCARCHRSGDEHDIRGGERGGDGGDEGDDDE